MVPTPFNKMVPLGKYRGISKITCLKITVPFQKLLFQKQDSVNLLTEYLSNIKVFRGRIFLQRQFDNYEF